MRVDDSQLFRAEVVRMEKAGSVSVRHSASAEAIFVGCWRNMSLARKSPVRNTPAVATRMTHAPKRVHVR